MTQAFLFSKSGIWQAAQTHRKLTWVVKYHGVYLGANLWISGIAKHFHPPASGVSSIRGAWASPQSFLPHANLGKSAIVGFPGRKVRLEGVPWPFYVVLLPLTPLSAC